MQNVNGVSMSESRENKKFAVFSRLKRSPSQGLLASKAAASNLMGLD
jgi:hypothetical protein